MKIFAPNWSYLAAASLGLIVVSAACSASDGSSLGEDDGSESAGGGDIGGGSGEGGVMFGEGGNNAGSGGNACVTELNVDDDGDGFTENQGDCNDCDPNTNPGAVEVVTPTMSEDGEAPKPADENCDGQIDEIFETCDTGLAMADSDPLHAAAAVGLCKQAADETDWGLVEAKWVRADGSPATMSPAMGILTDFGPNVSPRRGDAMLAISSGHARDASDPDACGDFSCQTMGTGTPPTGFPQDTPGCGGGTDINDDVGLEVTLRAPTNASGYTFDFNFYSFEYPEFVCTTFNDQFIALASPAPEGSINGNITFDSMSNPVSVNIAFFEVCEGCPLGMSELAGTGFDTWDDAGATSWLVTQAPVEGGEELTLRWAIWDTGDSSWDSTALIDNFTWIADSGEPVDVGTTPIPR
jgi:hypothetical protein